MSGQGRTSGQSKTPAGELGASPGALPGAAKEGVLDASLPRAAAAPPAPAAAPQVLIAAGCPHATVTRYRCLHLQEQLGANGITAAVEEWYDLERIDPQHWLPTAALVLQRVAFTPALGEIIDRMHAAGRPVVFDVDDLVFEPALAAAHRAAAALPPAEQQLYLEGVRRYAATLARCDCALAASPLLAELAERHGVKAFVHRNALGAEMLAWATTLHDLRRARGEAGTIAGTAAMGAAMAVTAATQAAATGAPRLVLGYGSGTPTHDVDFAEAAPAVLDILTRYPHAELWIAGPMQLPAELAGFGARVRRFPLLSWQDWFALAAQIDINLAPLEMGNVFCRAKSEIKFVEAAALGIPTVASQIDPFVEAITHGENGLLAATPAAWMAQLDRLAADEGLRRDLGAAARATVLSRYTPEARAGDLAQILPALLQPPPARPAEPFARLPVQSPASPKMNKTAPMPPTPVSSPAVEHGPVTSAHAGSAHAAPAATPFVPLTIHWLVSEPIAGSGGHTGIFRMIRHLVDFGHVCHVHMIPVNFMHGYTPAELQRHVDDHFFPTGAVYHQWDGTIGPADATVATFWRTVPPLLKLPLPGRRYYLVQDFEPYFYPMGLEYIQAEETYRQGLHCLTLGPWLASFLHEHYGAQADAFDFAVDTNVYYPAAVSRPPHRRVAFYARPSTPRRAYELGLEALALVKQRDPGVEIIFFGAEHHPPAPFPVTNAGLLNPWELAGLFSTCDVGVVFSTTNPSFVPFELMACRCAVVDLASERVAGLLEDGVNCRLAAPTPQAVAAAVLDLLWGSEARAAIVETAYRQVKASSWQQSARQIEAVMLAHTPPAQRVAAQMAAGDDVDVLAWQIHQLLDTGADSAALVDALRTTLYRTLAEKAALVQHVQAVEQRLAAAEAAAPTAGPRAALQPLADTLLDRAPVWLLGSMPVSKLALGQETLCQTFVADRSHLRRIELRFAPHAALHTGSLLVSLYEGDETLAGGRLVLSTILRATELPLDAPGALDFPPQPASYGQTYTLCLAAAELQRHPPAIWHFKAARFGGALSVRRTPAGSPPHDEPLGGAVAFQPFYGDRPPLLGPRHDPGDWHTPVRLAPAVARDLAARRAEELRRLGGQARTAVNKGGVRGLVAEIRSYLQWQLSGRRGE